MAEAALRKQSRLPEAFFRHTITPPGARRSSQSRRKQLRQGEVAFALPQVLNTLTASSACPR
jgi:hypothetical protein